MGFLPRKELFHAQTFPLQADQPGGRIEGFTFDRSKTLLDGGRQEMSWTGEDVGKLAGKPVRLRLALRNCALYSIHFI